MSGIDTRPASKPLRLKLFDLIDVLVVSEPEQIQWLNKHVDVVRPLDPKASWLHRIIEHRLRSDLDFGGPLPVFMSRADPQRTARHTDLTTQLDELRGAPGLEREEIADFVSGKRPLTELGASVQRWYHRLLSIKPRAHEDEDDIGVIVQRWCGRLFAAHYQNGAETYRAGKLLAGWASAPPWQTMFDRATGKLARAKQAVAKPAQDDRYCIHATTIGMENVAKTVRNLRHAAQQPDKKDLSPDDALRECLAAPPAVLRGCAAEVKPPFLDRPLTKRTVIVFLVARAFQRSGELDMAFLADGWSACPAHEVIPEMLRGVWHAAHHDEAEELKQVMSKINGWTRLFHRAAS